MIFKNFLDIKKNKKIQKDLQNLLKNEPPLFQTLKPNYKYSYSKKTILKYKKFSNIRIIGMGGSILGSEAIYDFLKKKINKKLTFVNNLNSNGDYFKDKKINLNLIISKSGNTLETIANANTLIKKNEKSIIITENKVSYLTNLAKKLKAEIFEHKNFVGGRYSVLSEVGMLPAELMNLDESKFKQFNNLIKNKTFVNNLINNVGSTLHLIKKDKFNSIILNYDEQSENFFKWYQQLIAESLGKKSKGLMPIVSSMPKDNHSLMQLYLDGPKKNIYTFFNVLDNAVIKIKNNNLDNEIPNDEIITIEKNKKTVKKFDAAKNKKIKPENTVIEKVQKEEMRNEKSVQLREVKTSTPIEVVKVDEGSNSTKPKKKGWWST